MADTIAKQTVRRIVKEKMKDARWSKFLGFTSADLNAGDVYPQSYIDALFQSHWYDNAYTLEDAYCFAWLHYFIYMGEVAIAAIHVGHTPGRDAAHRLNNEYLSSLTPPFRGKFWGGIPGGGGGADGYVEWAMPINAAVRYFDEDTDIHESTWVILPPGRAQLEVGDTRAEKTLLQIQQSNLARWPYGSEYIYVFSMNRWVNELDDGFADLKQITFPVLKDSISPWDIFRWPDGTPQQRLSRANRYMPVPRKKKINKNQLSLW